MKTTPINILLLHSLGKNNAKLTHVLDENGYHTETLSDIESAIEKITNQSVDLVICENKVNNYNGFAVFKMLMTYLRNYGVPFFLVLDNYDKEDMLIGLEIGIDNFIVSPINKDSLFYKIENQLSKRKQLDIFESENFKDYFHSSSVAMFFVNNNKINLVNDAFTKLYNGFTNGMMEIPVDNIFNITKNKQNELIYRRFQNGISNHCKLVNIPCLKDSALTYDISFYRGKNLETNHIFAEMVPSVLNEHVENHKDNQVVHYGVGYKEVDNLSEIRNAELVKLTKREYEVFELSSIGLPIKVIAGQLELSERTVEKHRANIMAKTNAKNIIEAIVYIQKQGNISGFNKMSY